MMSGIVHRNCAWITILALLLMTNASMAAPIQSRTASVVEVDGFTTIMAETEFHGFGNLWNTSVIDVIDVIEDPESGRLYIMGFLECQAWNPVETEDGNLSYPYDVHLEDCGIPEEARPPLDGNLQLKGPFLGEIVGSTLVDLMIINSVGVVMPESLHIHDGELIFVGVFCTGMRQIQSLGLGDSCPLRENESAESQITPVSTAPTAVKVDLTNRSLHSPIRLHHWFNYRIDSSVVDDFGRLYAISAHGTNATGHDDPRFPEPVRAPSEENYSNRSIDSILTIHDIDSGALVDAGIIEASPIVRSHNRLDPVRLDRMMDGSARLSMGHSSYDCPNGSCSFVLGDSLFAQDPINESIAWIIDIDGDLDAANLTLRNVTTPMMDSHRTRWCATEWGIARIEAENAIRHSSFGGRDWYMVLNMTDTRLLDDIHCASSTDLIAEVNGPTTFELAGESQTIQRGFLRISAYEGVVAVIDTGEMPPNTTMRDHEPPPFLGDKGHEWDRVQYANLIGERLITMRWAHINGTHDGLYIMIHGFEPADHDGDGIPDDLDPCPVGGSTPRCTPPEDGGDDGDPDGAGDGNASNSSIDDESVGGGQDDNGSESQNSTPESIGTGALNDTSGANGTSQGEGTSEPDGPDPDPSAGNASEGGATDITEPPEEGPPMVTPAASALLSIASISLAVISLRRRIDSS